eukprot:767585-Hanusia_phi.AAC.1
MSSFTTIPTIKHARQILTFLPSQSVCIDRMGAISVIVYKCEGGAKRKIYQTDQRNLFRKYPDRRSKAMAEITSVVRQEMSK